jgi:small subunit ribosomal protein S17
MSETTQSAGLTRASFRKTREGLVVSDKMEKTVVVAVERQVRHGLYGKSQRKTSKFVAHNEANEAKVGDTVAIAESRPLSRRKRWIVTRVVAKAQQI